MQRIISNMIKCKKCGDVIESKALHDYVACRCGACAPWTGGMTICGDWGTPIIGRS